MSAPYQLPQKTHDSIYAKIEARAFEATQSHDRPTAIILGGQPGAGKSGLAEMSKADFAAHDVVPVNVDELRYYHPMRRAIQRAEEHRFAELTDPHARAWAKQLFDTAIDTRRNIIFEGTMRDGGPICATMRRLQDIGYHVVVRTMAVSERDSIAGIFRRFEEQKASRGFGRWSPLEVHNDAYLGVPFTMQRIELEKLAHRVEVFNRRGTVLYGNKRETSGEWHTQPSAARVIEHERERPASSLQLRQREAEWSTILSMMRARRAPSHEIDRAQRARDVYAAPTAGAWESDEAEVARRSLALPGLAKAAGPALTFLRCYEEACGKFTAATDWRQIHHATLMLCMSVGQEPALVERALLEHSPGTVSLASRDVLHRAIEQLAPSAMAAREARAAQPSP